MKMIAIKILIVDFVFCLLLSIGINNLKIKCFSRDVSLIIINILFYALLRFLFMY